MKLTALTTPTRNRVLGVVIAAAVMLVTPLLRAENEHGPELRAGIATGLKYLALGGSAWMDNHDCASCHHAPLTIWSLNYAKQRGFDIDRDILAQVSSWTLEAKTRWRPEPETKPEPWTNKVAPVVAYLTLAADRAEPPLLPPELHATVVQHFLEKQEADGSWLSYVAHPPVLDCGETSTLYVLIALLGKDIAAEPKSPAWPDQKRRALEFLAGVKVTDELQPKLWRLLLRDRFRAAGADLPGARSDEERAVLSQQHEDGGWGQNPSLPSDAYATGQVLYFLEAAHGEIPADRRRRAVAFLLKTQQPDGSWTMTSRPRTLPKPTGGAKNLDIITYAASAWATMGLISTASK